MYSNEQTNEHLIFNRKFVRLIRINLSFDEINIVKLCLVETIDIKGVEESGNFRGNSNLPATSKKMIIIENGKLEN